MFNGLYDDFDLGEFLFGDDKDNFTLHVDEFDDEAKETLVTHLFHV